VRVLHCSNLPKHFFEDVVMNFQEIIAGTVGKENTFGTCYGRVKAGAMSLRALLDRRLSRQDPRVRRGGEFTNDPLETFGARAWRRSRTCRNCLHRICEKASSITWRRTSRRWLRRCTRRGAVIWDGKCTWHER